MVDAFHPTRGESDIGCDMAMESALVAIAKAEGTGATLVQNGKTQK